MSSDDAFLAALLQALANVKLEAIVVGGAAAILHGVPILTEDVVDVLVLDTPQNRTKLDELCEQLHRSRPVLISPLSTAVRLISEDELDIDVLFDEISGGLSFASLRSRSVAIAIGDHTATVACLEDVIHSKRAANRPKDQAQLPMLESFVRVKRAVVDASE